MKNLIITFILSGVILRNLTFSFLVFLSLLYLHYGPRVMKEIHIDARNFVIGNQAVERNCVRTEGADVEERPKILLASKANKLNSEEISFEQLSQHEISQKLQRLEKNQAVLEANIISRQKPQCIHHEELVRLGGRMIEQLRLYVDSCDRWRLHPHFLDIITETMQGYEDLVLPRIVDACYPNNDTKVRKTRAMMFTSIFVCQAYTTKLEPSAGSLHFFAEALFDLRKNLECHLSKECSNDLEERWRDLLIWDVDRALSTFSRVFPTAAHLDPESNTYQVATDMALSSIMELIAVTAEGSSFDELKAAEAGRYLHEIIASTMRQVNVNLVAKEMLLKDLQLMKDTEIVAHDEMKVNMEESEITNTIEELRKFSDMVFKQVVGSIKFMILEWHSLSLEFPPNICNGASVISFVPGPRLSCKHKVTSHERQKINPVLCPGCWGYL